MKINHARLLIAVAALTVLGVVNYSILAKERIIRSGEIIYLELAPVDPRSLMQGDYMALQFRLAQQIEAARGNASLEANARRAPLAIDSRRVATLAAGGDARLTIAFRLRGRGIWLGTNAYFFAEGDSRRYTTARYGEFRVSERTGEAVLVALTDEDLNRL